MGEPAVSARERVERGRLTVRRLFGLDRSGPPPPQTLPGQPLRPFTVPNAIGYVRLALIPIFLVLAFESDDGTDPAPVILFAVIGWGDYLDGIAARVTGQYSRLGALLDPVVDRLLVVSGVVVCWHFELLPRWLLAVLAGRELFMLLAGQAAMRRGFQLRINWPGRLAVAPVMGALFFGMCGLETFATVLLAIGVALALLATTLYLRDGREYLRAGKPST